MQAGKAHVAVRNHTQKKPESRRGARRGARLGETPGGDRLQARFAEKDGAEKRRASGDTRVSVRWLDLADAGAAVRFQRCSIASVVDINLQGQGNCDGLIIDCSRREPVLTHRCQNGLVKPDKG